MTAMVLSMTIGSVMMAACQNVETYCAAQVFYFVGFFGIQFSFTILIADALPLRHRTFVMGVTSTPSILSVWASGPAAQHILETIGYRWGFGCWSIVVPICSTPLLFLMFKYDKQARKAGLIKMPAANKTMRESALYHCKEFDVIGLTMLGSGLCLVLLAISIYSYQPGGWKSPLIISFIAVGFLLLAGFLTYEKYLAPATFLPWQLIKEPTVVFTNLATASFYISSSLGSAYIYSMLIVSFNQSVTNATYINNIDMVGASIANVLLGVAVQYNCGRNQHRTLRMGKVVLLVGRTN
nr:siderophore iron transporter [Colletotrichum truncatum]KAF6784679.1 siderophore iron transporter [Colletotrichum truncatum]